MAKLRNLKRNIAALFAAALMASPLGASLNALATEPQGLAADNLTITVGYFGGPYYEKKTFTLDELWALDVQYLDYTAIDNMPSVVIDHVAGVTLADLMDAAGIDLGSIENFNFWTNDKQGGYYNTLSKRTLIDEPRYCYYSLPDNFDYDEGRGNELAASDGVRVPSVIALADDWQRVLAGASFGSDYLNLNTDTRFRLVYGQTDASTRTASESAKWIHKIEVTLGGAPTLTLDASVLDLEVGSKFRSEPRVNAADPIIAANAEITWTSSDENIATVDANGEITVHAEGSAVITASFGGQSAAIAVNGTAIDNGRLTIDNGQLTVDNSGTGGAKPDDTPVESQPSTAGPVEVAPETKPVITVREISILPTPAAQSKENEGGVQNWRTDEMADAAVELPIMPENISALWAIAALTIFLLGGIFQYAESKRA